MADTKCRHRGTMTLTPCEDKGWETLDWCFYQDEAMDGKSVEPSIAKACVTEFMKAVKRNLMEDPKAVLIAIKLVCEHELLDNPYVRNVTLFKSKPKEL